MHLQGITPEQIVAARVRDAQIGEGPIRAGTVSAMLANIELLEMEFVSAEDRQSALQAIENLAPAIIALGLNKHVIWKNPKVQAVIDKVIRNNLKAGKNYCQTKNYSPNLCD